jgi:cardiolipin synthase
VNLPNRLTVLRIILVPVFVTTLVYWQNGRGYCRALALVTFLIACATDALDGWIARRTNQKTRLGSLIDPLADKILLSSAYLAFALLPGLPESAHLPVWITILVLFRDLLLLTGAGVIFMMHNQFDAKTNFTGKATTVFQMALVMAILADVPLVLRNGLLAGTAILTVVSGGLYLKSGAAQLNGGFNRA